MRILPKYIAFLLAFICLETLIILYVDRPVSLAMRELDTTFHSFVNFFRHITDIAKGKWNLIFSAIGCAAFAFVLRCHISTLTRQRLLPIAHTVFAYFLSIALSGIFTNILKDTLGRARPVLLDRENIYGFFLFHTDAVYNSMPSGHATTAMALAVTLFLHNRKHGALWISLGIILCLSRVIVNAHYLSDILAGGLIGTLTALAIRHAINYNGINQIKCRIFPIDNKRKPA